MATTRHYVQLLNNKKLKDNSLNFVREMYAGGEPIAKKTALKLEHEFQRLGVKDAKVNIGYGASELASSAIHQQDRTNLLNTPGFPYDGIDIRVVDENGNKVKDGERGELEIKSPARMKGYFNNQVETNKVFTDDGYYKTGDIGIKQENGYRIDGRKKNVFVDNNGDKLYLFDIENIAIEQEGVLEVEASILDNNKIIVNLVLEDKTKNKKDLIKNLDSLIKSEIKNVDFGYKIWKSFPINEITSKRDHKKISEENSIRIINTAN